MKRIDSILDNLNLSEIYSNQKNLDKSVELIDSVCSSLVFIFQLLSEENLTNCCKMTILSKIIEFLLNIKLYK